MDQPAYVVEAIAAVDDARLEAEHEMRNKQHEEERARAEAAEAERKRVEREGRRGRR